MIARWRYSDDALGESIRNVLDADCELVRSCLAGDALASRNRPPPTTRQHTAHKNTPRQPVTPSRFRHDGRAESCRGGPGRCSIMLTVATVVA